MKIGWSIEKVVLVAAMPALFSVCHPINSQEMFILRKLAEHLTCQRMKIGLLLRLESVWRIWLQKSLQKRQDFVSGRKKGCCVIHYIPI